MGPGKGENFMWLGRVENNAAFPFYFFKHFLRVVSPVIHFLSMKGEGCGYSCQPDSGGAGGN